MQGQIFHSKTHPYWGRIWLCANCTWNCSCHQCYGLLPNKYMNHLLLTVEIKKKKC